MNLLPLYLNLAGKRVLLVGGGSVAHTKLLALRETGCLLRTVSLAYTDGFLSGLTDFPAEQHTRAFTPIDLDGIHLTISATNDPTVNAFIAQCCREKGVWLNAVDDPVRCDVQFPSILRRGPFTVAVSTQGAFPGLSRILREALELLVPAEMASDFQALADLRQRMRHEPPDPARRPTILRDILAQLQRELLPSESRS